MCIRSDSLLGHHPGCEADVHASFTRIRVHALGARDYGLGLGACTASKTGRWGTR
jgi:hypothetical protein